LTDTPLISNWSSKESNNLILEIISNSHIKKAIFVYNTNKEFICKFEGVIQAQKELKINHDIIKNCALLNTPYKGYIFNYERFLVAKQVDSSLITLLIILFLILRKIKIKKRVVACFS
jgi:NUMOD1 domain